MQVTEAVHQNHGMTEGGNGIVCQLEHHTARFSDTLLWIQCPVHHCIMSCEPTLRQLGFWETVSQLAGNLDVPLAVEVLLTACARVAS